MIITTTITAWDAKTMFFRTKVLFEAFMLSSVFLRKYKIPITAKTHPIELIRYILLMSSGLEIGKKLRRLGNKESTKKAANPIKAKSIT
jgi:hypothetical protein